MLLAPTGITTNLLGFCLARTATRHGILVHGATAMSNHVHWLLTDPEGLVSDFARDLNGLIARAMNSHYGRWENFWASGRTNLVELVTEETVYDELAYTATNPVAAGLVRSHRDWPGLCTTPTDVLKGPMVFQRPDIAFFKRSKLPMEAHLAITMPPQMEGTSPEDYARELSDRIKAREREIRAKAKAEGKSFLGARKARRQDPNARPTTIEPRRKLEPELACSDTKQRIAELAELVRFREAYEEARQRWMAGERPVTFPAGTTKMRHYPGVHIEGTPRAPPATDEAV
jgi:REP element-mobilizing transposase RayT